MTCSRIGVRKHFEQFLAFEIITMMRAIAGVLALLVCAGGAVMAVVPIFAWAPSGFAAVLLLILGFVALGVMRTPTTPLRPLRVTIGFGFAIVVAMTISLALSARAADVPSIIACSATALGALAVLCTVERRPRGPHRRRRTRTHGRTHAVSRVDPRSGCIGCGSVADLRDGHRGRLGCGVYCGALA